jgi:hypothetical protein
MNEITCLTCNRKVALHENCDHVDCPGQSDIELVAKFDPQPAIAIPRPARGITRFRRRSQTFGYDCL